MQMQREFWVPLAIVDLYNYFHTLFLGNNFLKIFPRVMFSIFVLLWSKIKYHTFGLYHSRKIKEVCFHILFSSHNERVAELYGLKSHNG